MLHWKEWPYSNCPRCQAPEESTTHVWRCPDPAEANSLWEKSLRQLKNWMLTQWTPILLAQIICERLSAWRSNTVPTLKATPHSQLVKVLELQDAMGWQSFFEGAPALGWSGYMNLYYNSIGSNRNGRHGLSSIIKKLWNIVWDLWEHQNGVAHDKTDGLTAERPYCNKKFKMNFKKVMPLFHQKCKT
jgi:hypothetical protein